MGRVRGGMKERTRVFHSFIRFSYVMKERRPVALRSPGSRHVPASSDEPTPTPRLPTLTFYTQLHNTLFTLSQSLVATCIPNSPPTRVPPRLLGLYSIVWYNLFDSHVSRIHVEINPYGEGDMTSESGKFSRDGC